ncbi:hypothetical protein [Acinetobacter sp. YH12218]|uniref:hypothetical protein n=1 Tax=Acinetobacter sp. YH12218 TaxID=2601152 RepID=UPI0015D1F2FF|nr:hypothetical protein [Acinetobacter sp. YH12218]
MSMKTIYEITEEKSISFSTLKDEQPLLLDQAFDVVMLPSVYHSKAFHVGAADLFSYLKDNIGEDVVQILVSDEDYQEVGLHSKALRIGVVIITAVIAPIFTSVLSDYISNELNGSPGDELEMTVIIERPQQVNIKLDYKGDVNEVHKVLDKIKELADGKENIEPPKLGK